MITGFRRRRVRRVDARSIPVVAPSRGPRPSPGRLSPQRRRRREPGRARRTNSCVLSGQSSCPLSILAPTARFLSISAWVEAGYPLRRLARLHASRGLSGKEVGRGCSVASSANSGGRRSLPRSARRRLLRSRVSYSPSSILDRRPGGPISNLLVLLRDGLGGDTIAGGLERFLQDCGLLDDNLLRRGHEARRNVHCGGLELRIGGNPRGQRLHRGCEIIERFLELGRRLERGRVIDLGGSLAVRRSFGGRLLGPRGGSRHQTCDQNKKKCNAFHYSYSEI